MNNDLNSLIDRYGRICSIHALCRPGTYRIVSGGRVIKSYHLTLTLEIDKERHIGSVVMVSYYVEGSHNMELIKDMVENPTMALLNMKHENQIVADIAVFRTKSAGAVGTFEFAI